MSHNPKEAEKEMEKAIFISADCWLEVFGLLPRSQLGLGIATISHRFDHYVDEHFKTRKWTLGEMEIGSKREMKIVNSDENELPIPQNPLPNKVIGFRSIAITFINHKVLNFLRRFDRLFASCATKLNINKSNDFRKPNIDVRILEFIVRTIWPMFKDTIYLIDFDSINLRQMRQLVPSILNDCPALRVVAFTGTILPKFPPDDSANASNGQAVAKWLFTPRPDNLMKVLYVENSAVGKWPSTVEKIKAAFSSASSPVSFVISVAFPPSSSSISPFELTNELTGEKLALSQQNAKAFMLLRCPIGESIEEGDIDALINGRENNIIAISIVYGGVDNGLLDGSPGPSGDH